MSELFFHESSVEELSLVERQFLLRLSGVATQDGDLVSAIVLVNAVSVVLVDGEEVATLVYGPGDGEVLSLDILEDGVKFIVEWEEYSPRRSVTRSYYVGGQSPVIRVA